MVITGAHVIHVARRFRAALALVEPGAAVAVSAEDSLADCLPVRGEAVTPVRPCPLWHRASLRDVEVDPCHVDVSDVADQGKIRKVEGLVPIHLPVATEAPEGGKP